MRSQKYNADYDLSAKEGADSLAFISLMEEKLRPALVRLSVSALKSCGAVKPQPKENSCL